MGGRAGMALSSRDASEAARYNRRMAGRIGWAPRYPQIAYLLGLDRQCTTDTGFAQAVADWQKAQKTRLTVDGKIGSNTWRHLKKKLDSTLNFTPAVPWPAWLDGDSSRPAPQQQPVVPSPATGSGPKWMRVAESQMLRWDREIASWGADRNRGAAEDYLDWDEAYFAASPMWGSETHEPGLIPEVNSTTRNWMWCAAFVNYCLHRAGYSHTGSAGARSFLMKGWWHFRALDNPRRGCVVVVGRGSSAQHVAFLDTVDGLPSNPRENVTGHGQRYRLLGGNQGHAVTGGRRGHRISRRWYRSTLFAATDAHGNKSPYLWPEVGPGRCNIQVPTERRHYCRFITK